VRLADFILNDLDSILSEWETFARSIWPGVAVDPLTLRDHAADILRATAHDMKSAQTRTQQSDKSKGAGTATGRLDGASEIHAVGRAKSGFDLTAVVAEYRALRASVVRLWQDSAPHPDRRDLDDLTRFNESIDQSLTEAVRSFTEHLDHSRQMFLAVLGHDLRNPLNSISLAAQLLALSKRLDPSSIATASQISASAGAMSTMISDLLDFTGTGLGGPMPLSPAPMDLKTLAEEVVNEMRTAHPDRELHVHATSSLTGTWDRGRLRQVLSNLIGNAIYHGAVTSSVDLSVREDGDSVVADVHNEGFPIPPDALGTIFEPLVRGPSTNAARPRQPGSLGLGLYIARAVAIAHSGTLSVLSSAAAGTTFTLRLPRRVSAV
jgi:signal transduction histidine kinase